MSSGTVAAALGDLPIIEVSENWVLAIGSCASATAAVEKELGVYLDERGMATDCLRSRLIGHRKDGGHSACSDGVIETTSV